MMNQSRICAARLISRNGRLRKLIAFLYRLTVGTKSITTDRFLRKITAADKVLEIGPFVHPRITGENVFYFDVLNSEQLLTRAKEHNYAVDQVPAIDFVSPTGDLKIVDKEFDKILSSHCIEHQPDLITHLNDATRILKPGGEYYLIVPDKRYCFDALLPETNIGALISAFEEKKIKHTLKSIIEHRALTTHNNPYQHWLGYHGAAAENKDQIARAIREFRDANDGYVDVHAWQFTPVSFAKIIALLHAMKFIELQVSEIYPTAPFSLEFHAVLKRN